MFNSAPFNRASFNNANLTTITFNGTSTFESTAVAAAVASCAANGVGTTAALASKLYSVLALLSSSGNIDVEALVENILTSWEAFNMLSRNVTAKVEIYFDDVPVEFGAADIVQIDFLEEAGYENTNPLSAVSSNEMDIVLRNTNGRFTPTNQASPYYGKLIPNIKVVSYIGILDLWIPMGNYYVANWDTVSSTLSTSLVCYDVLQQKWNDALPPMRVVENTTLYALFEQVLTSMGITSYTIDEALQVPVAIGWLPNGTYKDALNYLTEAGGCYVYAQRNDNVNVQRISTATPIQSITETEQIVDANIPTKYYNVYSKLIIDKYAPTKVASQTLYTNKNLTVPAGTQSYTLKFNNPVSAVENIKLTNAVNTSVQTFSAYTWGLDLTLNNTGVEETIELVVTGEIVETSPSPVVSTDSALQQQIGTKQLSISNKLIQDTSHIQTYSNELFKIVSNPRAFLQLHIKGNPDIEVGQTYTVNNPTDYISNEEVFIYRSTLSYDGGLSGKLTGIRIGDIGV